MTEAGWFDWLQRWWWLAGTILVVVARIWKTAAQTSKKLEDIDKIKVHDESIRLLQEKITSVEHISEDIKKDLTKRGTDNRVIHRTLLAMLDAMINNNCDGLASAKQQLREHLIDQ